MSLKLVSPGGSRVTARQFLENSRNSNETMIKTENAFPNP